MATKSKWFRRFLALLVIIAVAGVAAYFLLLPVIARMQITRILRDMGISESSFNLRQVSLQGIELSQIDLGRTHWGTAETVAADYSIASLWNGRVRSIQVSNIHWRIIIRNGQIEFGPDPLAASSTPAAKLNDVPFDLLQAPGMSLTVEADGREFQFTTDATFTRTGTGLVNVRLDAAWPRLNATMFSTATVDLTASTPSVQLAATVPPFELSDRALLADILPQLLGAQVGGKYSVNATAILNNGLISPRITITGSGISLERPDWPIVIDSASSEITITSIDPIQTAPAQRIAIQKARAGKLDVQDGDLEFAITGTDGDRVKISRAAWSMGEYGRFSAAPFAFNPAHLDVTTRLSGEKISLGRWLDLLTSGRASGDGLFEGTIAVSLNSEGPNRIRLSEGALQAQPSTGWTHIGDAELLNNLLSQAPPPSQAAAQREQIIAKMRDALRDYEFVKFRVEFIPQQNDVLCRVQTTGQGRTGQDPLQFALLTININNFNSVLNQALRFRHGMNQAQPCIIL